MSTFEKINSTHRFFNVWFPRKLDHIVGHKTHKNPNKSYIRRLSSRICEKSRRFGSILAFRFKKLLSKRETYRAQRSLSTQCWHCSSRPTLVLSSKKQVKDLSVQPTWLARHAIIVSEIIVMWLHKLSCGLPFRCSIMIHLRAKSSIYFFFNISTFLVLVNSNRANTKYLNNAV